MSGKATERCTVFADGHGVQIELLYTLSTKAIPDKDGYYGFYAPEQGDDPRPKPPTTDGVYLLIDNKWVPE